MSQDEITGHRDLKYSLKHRPSGGVLPPWCYCMNLDYIEYRGDKTEGELKMFAFIEVAESSLDLASNYPFNKKQENGEIRILCELTKITNIPSYIVIHNSDLSEFKVYYELPSNKSIRLPEDKYWDWIKNIDKKQITDFIN